MMPPSPGVMRKNFDRVEIGMTFDEVELVFGMPDDYGFVKSAPRFAAGSLVWSANVGSWEDGSHARIIFQDGRVSDKDWHSSNKPILDKIQRWLHLS